MTEFDTYVPAVSLTGIDPASGIVGRPVGESGRIEAYYEGNRYGASNIVTWADRLHHAAGRMKENYPTVARAWLPATDLTRVGTYHYEYGRFEPAGGWELVQVAKWLALALDDEEAAKLVRRWEDGEVESIDSGVLAREFAATHRQAVEARR